MTLKELYDDCKYWIDMGEGDKEVYLSDDEEGDGYHSIAYPLGHSEEVIDSYKKHNPTFMPSGLKPNTLLLG